VSEASRPPDFISLEAHRDHGHPVERWIRWIFVGALGGLALVALLGVFGQRPSSVAAVTPDATLRVRAPDAIRGGLLFQGRFEVVATKPLRRPTLVLRAGWFDNLTTNTIVPEPVRATSVEKGLARVCADAGGPEADGLFPVPGRPDHRGASPAGRRPPRRAA